VLLCRQTFFQSSRKCGHSIKIGIEQLDSESRTRSERQELNPYGRLGRPIPNNFTHYALETRM
jgi:hypothetical protein